MSQKNMRKLSLLELNRLDKETFKGVDKTPLVLILDNIRSAHNVGAAFRTADGFALLGIHLCGITAQPPNREITKTAIGATESVSWTYYNDTCESIRVLKNQQFQIIGVEQTNQSVDLIDVNFDFSKPTALVFGNEVSGISDEVIPLLDSAVEIPQWGTKHSLNVSVCVGILSFEFVRQYQIERKNLIL
jgi:tRNA G18 (ribose-2'-O)-methylase SpoU